MPGAGELLRGFFQCVDDRIFRPDVIDEVAFIAKEADVVSSAMDDKLGVTVQEIKNFGQFLFEGRGALQEFVGETMDGESLGMDLTITWIEIRSEEHTSELQSLMRISYAAFCLKKKKDK